MKNNHIGKVKFYSHSKQFGFIERESGSDVFIQLNRELGATPITLTVGQSVKFSLVNHNGREQADNITVLEPEDLNNRE